MHWHLSDRADPRAAALADRHYNRQKIGSTQFVPPGRCLVLTTGNYDALWITSYPFAQYVKHNWAGSWVCSCFRNESSILSSQLIKEAVSATRWYAEYSDNWNVPTLGMVTFVDTAKIKSTHPGYCYKMAGWRHVGYTKGGLVALQLLPDEMPESERPIGAPEAKQMRLFTA